MRVSELVESLDNPYPFKLHRHSDGGYSAVFYVEDDRDDPVTVNFEYDEDADAYAVEFDRSGKFGMTGGGHAPRIMATVLAVIRKFVSNENPTAVMFSSKEDSRTRLYSRLVKKMAPGFGLVDGTTADVGRVLRRWFDDYKNSKHENFLLVTKDRIVS